MNKQTGFTIVELLIVILVISILASVTIVAYGSMQNRASDAAVKADLRNYAHKIMEYKAANGAFPTGGGGSAPAGVSFKVNKSAYATNMHNFIYCVDQAGGNDKFIVAAASRSGDRFAYSSEEGLHSYGFAWGGVVGVCSNEGYASYTYSYGYNSNGTWFAWTQ